MSEEVVQNKDQAGQFSEVISYSIAAMGKLSRNCTTEILSYTARKSDNYNTIVQGMMSGPLLFFAPKCLITEY